MISPKDPPTRPVQPLPPSLRVVHAVARAESVHPIELVQPLADVIDPDALDALLDHHAESGTGFSSLSFRYHGYEVTLHGDGRVSTAPVGE
jgi:hypothetical protein